MSVPQEPTDTPAEPATSYSGMPGWVRWFVVVAVVLGLLLVVAALAGGEHGPGRHLSSGPAGEPVTVAAGGR